MYIAKCELGGKMLVCGTAARWWDEQVKGVCNNRVVCASGCYGYLFLKPNETVSPTFRYKLSIIILLA